MPETNDLRTVERRAWTLYFEDGLWDIFFGLLFLAGGLRSLTGSLWYYLLVIAGILALFLGKRWLTLPRLGLIKFGPQRKARTKIVRIVIIGAVIITAVVFILAITGANLPGTAVGWLFVFMLPGVFLLMAYMMDFKRLYLYTVLVAIFTVASELVGGKTAAWAQIIAGVIPLLVGIFLLFRFLHRYPAVDEDALAQGGHNGQA